MNGAAKTPLTSLDSCSCLFNSWAIWISITTITQNISAPQDMFKDLSSRPRGPGRWIWPPHSLQSSRRYISNMDCTWWAQWNRFSLPIWLTSLFNDHKHADDDHRWDLLDIDSWNRPINNIPQSNFMLLDVICADSLSGLPRHSSIL